MRCVICNCVLTAFEATRRNAHTGEFLDICNHCFQDLKDIVPTRDRKDLVNQSVFDDNEDEEDYNVDCTNNRDSET